MLSVQLDIKDLKVLSVSLDLKVFPDLRGLNLYYLDLVVIKVRKEILDQEDQKVSKEIQVDPDPVVIKEKKEI